MMKFTDVTDKTPRLVVMHRNLDGKRDEFQWGVSPGLDVAKLIGCIVRAQTVIASGCGEGHDCKDIAFVIALGPDGMEWWVDPKVPTDSLLGLLESVKVGLIGSHSAQQTMANRVAILGPNGKPIPR